MTRGYYLTDLDGLLSFPVAEEWNSDTIRRAETDIALESERGRKFVYKQVSRRVWQLLFKAISETELEFFTTLHEAVGGQETPFYFVFDVDESPGNSVLVRKEAQFEPVCVGGWRASSGIVRHYDYTLTLTEEIDTEFSIEE